jgi:hypothetical protein
MNAIRAIVRGGRLEVEEPLNLPDGTELLIPLPNGAPETKDEDGPLSPEEIVRVLAAMEQMQSFDLTEAERAAWEADRQARKAWEIAHFEEHAEKLRRMWDAPIPPR